MSEYRDKTLGGVYWSTVNQVVNNVVTLVIVVILARLLSPREFGLIGMVTIFTGFAGQFSDLGLGAALIQDREVTQTHLSSVFWVNVLTGLVLTGLFVLSAPYIAAFYDETALAGLTSVLALNFAIGSFSSVHRIRFRRKIDFRTLTIVGISASFLAGVVGVAMAYNDYGVWSLVGKSLTLTTVEMAGLWVASSWRPSFVLSTDALKELLGFSLNLLGDKSLTYWTRRVDDLLIGKFIGSDALGLYTKAYGILLLPTTKISNVISRVLFPSLASIQNDPVRVKRVYLRITRTIALLTFPLMIGLFVTAESFVLTVFGPKWSGMIFLAKVFSILGIWQSVGTLVGNLYMSQGRTDLQFRVGMFLRAHLIGAIVLGMYWGISGVAICYTIASLLNSYPVLYFAGRLVDLTYTEFLRTLSGVFACAVAMGALTFGLGTVLPADWPAYANLLVQVPFGIATYWALVWGFGVDAYRDLIDLLQREWQKRRSRA